MNASDERIQRALDGLLSPDELAVLQADVVRDADLRAAYVDQAWLHASLRAQRDSLVELLDDNRSASPDLGGDENWGSRGRSPSRFQRWPVVVWTAALAACVTLLASAALFGKGTLFRRPVATLVQAENCQWAGSDLPTAVNSRLSAGTLALVQGIATLRFTNGATVTIEAPTKIEIVDAMHCRLLEGSLVADVPEPAHGFTIDTPDIKVIDLGTKFGVTAGSAGNSQVHVFDGEVEVDGLPSGQRKRIKEGKGLNVASGNTTAGQEPTQGRQMAAEGGWTAIPTSFGRGRDSYARRGDNGAPLGAQPLLIVKHTDLEAGRTNERRAVLTFDVSQFATARAVEAQLILAPEPSGFGFSALVPDSRFAVYGLTDEALDTWEENEMRWATLPGCADDGPDLNRARRLAEFWIPRGGSGGPLVVRGAALAEFVRADADGLVSFVIVRETGESHTSGLAHAFASKEHPAARPPTLRLK